MGVNLIVESDSVQDILCYSDITLEPLGDNYSETDGFGVEHTCKDWTQLFRLRYGQGSLKLVS